MISASCFGQSDHMNWFFISNEPSESCQVTFNGRKVSDVSWGPPENADAKGIQMMSDADGHYFGKDGVILSSPEKSFVIDVSKIEKSSNVELFEYLFQKSKFKECKFLMHDQEDAIIVTLKAFTLNYECVKKCMILCQDKKKAPKMFHTLSTPNFKIDVQNGILTVDDCVFKEYNREYIRVTSDDSESFFRFMSTIDKRIKQIIISEKDIQDAKRFYTEIKSEYQNSIGRLKVMSQVNIPKQIELEHKLMIKRDEYRAQREADRIQREKDRVQREADRTQRKAKCK